MFRSLKERPRGILSMLKMRTGKTAPEPGILAMTIHTGSTGKETKNFKLTGYWSAARGESIMFENTNQSPPGYVFVPTGNVYITRHCRRLTNESYRSLFTIYRNPSLDDRSPAIGMHVPRDVLEQVKSDYDAFITRASESLWRKLYGAYPKMPPADRTEVHRIISTQFSNPTEKTALKNLDLRVQCYARDSYTPYKVLLEEKGWMNKEELSKVGEKLADTLASWRGQT